MSPFILSLSRLVDIILFYFLPRRLFFFSFICWFVFCGRVCCPPCGLCLPTIVVVVVVITWRHILVAEFIAHDSIATEVFYEPNFEEPIKMKRKENEICVNVRLRRSTLTQTLQCARCIPFRQVVLRHKFIFREKIGSEIRNDFMTNR